MGFMIRGAVSIGVGAAVIGLAKLRRASDETRKSVKDADSVGAKARGLADYGKKLRAFVKDPYGATKRTVAEGLAGRDTEALKARQRVVDKLKEAEAHRAQASRRHAQGNIKTEIQLQRIENQRHRLLLREAKLNQDIADQRRKDISVAIKGMNSLIAASREARNWYKVLFGTKSRRSSAATAATQQVKQFARSIKSTQQVLNQLSLNMTNFLSTIGGVNILGGSKDFFGRSMGLARAREDALITFETLLGTKEASEDIINRISKFSASTPFQRADIIEGSRLLLAVTKDNVDANEDLYKLAANMAALKPGTSVTDAAQALVNASVGEFDMMKRFNMIFKADDFKSLGRAGGAKYVAGVMEAIKGNFTDMTGGRDLVGSLSSTLSGLMSTTKDNIELVLENFGIQLVDKLELKAMLNLIIPTINEFAANVGSVLSGDASTDSMSNSMRVMVGMFVDLINSAKYFRDILINGFTRVTDWFNSLDGKTADMIAKLGSIGSLVFAGFSLAAPLLIGLAAVVGTIAGPVGAVFSGIASSLPLVIQSLVFVKGAFFAFKNEGESTREALKRLLFTVIGFGMAVWSAGKQLLGAMWGPIKDQVGPALGGLHLTVKEFVNALWPFIESIFATGNSLDFWVVVFGKVGTVVGWVIRRLLDLRILNRVIGLLSWLLRRISPLFKATMSDIKMVTGAIIGFMAGTNGAFDSMKTIILGVTDTLLMPFREMYAQLFDLNAEMLRRVAEKVTPLSSTVGGMLSKWSGAMQTVADTAREGFLATRDELVNFGGGFSSEFQFELSADVNLTQPVTLDGEKVAENQARVDMRARNSGRGGNPSDPDQMGYVISEGRIRQVSTLEALGQGVAP